MRLTKLNLANFRGFSNREQAIDLDHNVVLLYGRNASGKTSVFDAVELLLTGSIRRFQPIDDLSSILINAKNPDYPAIATLQLTDSRGSRSAEAEIQMGHDPLVQPALSRAESDLFLHATYLQQSDIRRLVTSDSVGLGDVIRSLAVDERVYRLEQALGEAGISRSTGVYTAARRRVDALIQEAAQLTVERERLLFSISSIETITPDYSALISMLQSLAAKFTIPIETSNEVTIRSAIETVDRKLQEALKLAIVERGDAEKLLQEWSLFDYRKREIGNAELALSDLDIKRKESDAKVSQCDIRIIALQEQLAAAESAPETSERRLALVRALEHLQSLPNLEVCPVCDQEFSDLNAHIADKLLNLRAQQTESENAISKLQTDLDVLMNERQKLSRDIAALDHQIQRLKDESSSFARGSLQFAERVKPGIKDQISPEELNATVQNRALKAKQDVEELNRLAGNLQMLTSSFEATRRSTIDVKKRMSALETRDSAMKLKLQRAQSARERMDAFVDIAQEARRRLSAGIDEVLQEFVMGKTKSAFEDLFRRLARDPFFQVTVSDSRVKYHKPEVDWRAVYKGREFPGEGVFSQGELNSCAIAFFLALATSHPAGLKLLMLDDPVQNMDEMHIEEFGNVLKFLKDDLGWQIVVGLHDQSVYQYLTRQLYPCSEGQSLISYGFEESKDGTRLTKADSVEFNRAALIAEVA